MAIQQMLPNMPDDQRASDRQPPNFAALDGEVRALLGSMDRSERSGELLKPLWRERQAMVRAFHTAGAPGRQVVMAQTDVVDAIVRGLYGALASKLWPASTPTCALIALGGYGRGELNPYSDLDLLFLCQAEADDQVRQLIDGVLYPLWDLGFSVGHSARTLGETMAYGKRDLTVITALLEARLLDGSRDLFTSLCQRVQKSLSRKQGKEFIRKKLEERDRRHVQFENSPMVLEPNVKESPGGLRDIHTALWATKAVYGIASIEEIEARRLCEPEEALQVQAALDFYLRVRNELHFSTGRRTDTLAMEVQDALSAQLGYEERDGLHAVERFMQEYYRHAVNVFLFSRSMLWRCQERKGWFGSIIRNIRRTSLDNSFALSGRRIEFRQQEDVFLERPLLTLKVFLYCARHDSTLSETVRRQLRGALYNRRRVEALRTPQATDLFMKILAEPHAAKALRIMHQTGVLGIILPEFEELTGLIQYHLFHRYTIDDHTLRAVRCIDDLVSANDPELRTLADLARRQNNRALVKLALLCHDLGKSHGQGHVESGARMVRDITQRLELPADDADAIIFLVQQHLLMNHTSQRRNLDDPKVIARFGQTVGSVERLAMLYLLTYGDTRAVGPKMWTSWKGSLLLELYSKGASYLSRELDVGETIERIIQQARAEVEEQAGPEIDPKEIERFFELMPPRYFRASRPEQIIQHLIARREISGNSLVLRQFHPNGASSTELLVITDGHRGVFAKIVGVMAAHRINILGAQAHTDLEGLAVDTLWVKQADPRPVHDSSVWQAVERDLRKVLAGGADIQTLIRGHDRFYQTLKRRPNLLPCTVKLDNTVADDCTVIDIVAEDHLGLLYTIAQTLFEEGLDVVLAKVSTEGNRASDTFYVTDDDGEKILDSDKQEALVRSLREALDASLALAPS